MRKCCKRNLTSRILEETFFIIQLSSQASINILEEEDFNGVTVLYRSHLEDVPDFHQQAFFRYDSQMYTQGEDALHT